MGTPAFRASAAASSGVSWPAFWPPSEATSTAAGGCVDLPVVVCVPPLDVAA